MSETEIENRWHEFSIAGFEKSKLISLIDDTFKAHKEADQIRLLTNAIRRYPEGCLSPIHYHLVRRCCQLRCYDQALPVMDLDIDSFRNEHDLLPTDYLQYHFYGALCYAALGKYARSFYFLSLVIATPGNATSLIQLEAYRKFVLIGLIKDGKVPPLPRTVATQTNRSITSLAAAYLDFAAACEAQDTGSYKMLESYQVEFEKDGNLGLARSAIAALPSHKIQALRNIYITIPLEDVARKLELSADEVKATIEEMVSSKRLLAEINSENGTIHFPSRQMTTEEELASLEKMVEEVSHLGVRMESLQRQLELDEECILGTSDSSGSRGKRPIYPPGDEFMMR